MKTFGRRLCGRKAVVYPRRKKKRRSGRKRNMNDARLIIGVVRALLFLLLGNERRIVAHARAQELKAEGMASSFVLAIAVVQWDLQID